ncbi:hypothetical protein B296_00018995 [Ensete ventricosum]|uniref:Uncharacterized protein n=1 Tax=Ensete ventricosum TaxID=4639 RepID=A0A426ZMX7_ENSVE|nr:hypothetical protein B296_00018995 [Ensete ventricosum]
MRESRGSHLRSRSTASAAMVGTMRVVDCGVSFSLGSRTISSCLRSSVVTIIKGGVGCSKGATAIRGRQAAECTTIVEEGNGSIERVTTASRVHFDAGHDQGSWQRKIDASSIFVARDCCWPQSKGITAKDRCWQCYAARDRC